MLVDLKKEQILNIGVVGLGLIGGSLSKALKKYTSHNVYGCDIDPDTIQAAFNAGAIDFSIEDGDFSMSVSYTHLMRSCGMILKTPRLPTGTALF